MPRKVMLTVDVEAQPCRSDEKHIERLVYGNLGNGEGYGINKMFDIADQYGIKLTCFFDYAESGLHGPRWLNVARYICARGHDLQAHLHPEFVNAKIWQIFLGVRENDLFKVNDELADFLVNYLVDQHAQITEAAPAGFRGGGYRFNDHILKALCKYGVKYDLSYNPARVNQVFNVGVLPPFQWDSGITELPVTCLNTSNTLTEFNFNDYRFQAADISACVNNLLDYIDQCFHKNAQNIPTLVMHCWSFLNFNKKSGYYDSINCKSAEIFSEFCSRLVDKYEVVSCSDLAKSGFVGCQTRKYRQNIFSLPASGETGGHPCPVCGAGEDELEDNAGIAKRRCKKCGSLERQRALAKLLVQKEKPIALEGKKILHLSGSHSEGLLLNKFANAKISKLDIREDLHPDIAADICSMPQIESGSFDAILGAQFLSHVHDLPAALGELSRVLKDDGFFLQNDDSAPDGITREITDLETITRYWGKEAYDKYKIGRFRTFGEIDLDELFAPWFERDKFSIIDDVTGKTEIWNIWRKTDVKRQLEAANISFKLDIYKESAPEFREKLEKDEFLFFDKHLVEPGKTVKVYGRTTARRNRDIHITDINGKCAAVLRMRGFLSEFGRKCLDVAISVEDGVPCPLGEVEIPADLQPGVYFIDNRWLFFVRKPVIKDSIVIVVPIATMQMFSDFGGHSRYSLTGVWWYRCSNKRPLAKSVLPNDLRLKYESINWLANQFADRITFIADHELPDIKCANFPGLLLLLGRSEYWTNAAIETFKNMLDTGVNIFIAASETMYAKLLHEANKDKFIINKHDRIRNGEIRDFAGCNCFDGGFISDDMYKNDIGYGNFTVLNPGHFLLAGTGLKRGDIIELRTAGYEGLPISGYDSEDYPSLDMEKLAAWHNVEMVAFSMGKKGPDKRIDALAFFDAGYGKGKIVSMGGMSWVFSDVFVPDKKNPALVIMENAIKFLLAKKEQPTKSPTFQKKAVSEAIIQETELNVDSCPICGDKLEIFDNKQNCPVCKSRARVRAIYPLLNSVLLPWAKDNPVVSLPMLGFSMSSQEAEAMGTLRIKIHSASLYGKYAHDGEAGVDVRDLSRYAENSFSAIYSCLLFDYSTEHEQALRQCYNVLAPGGIFLTHIAPYRLLPDASEPVQTSAIKGRPDYFGYLPADQPLPSIKVGEKWFYEAMRNTGFDTRVITVADKSGIISKWFIGIKPQGGKSGNDNHANAAAKNSLDRNIAETDSRCVYSITIPFNNALYKLDVDYVSLHSASLVFLEDACLEPDKRKLICCTGKRDNLLISEDGGRTFTEFGKKINFDDKIRNVKSLLDGSYIIRAFSGKIYHVSSDEKLISSHDAGEYRWHGNQGIGQSKVGIVMFAENPRQTEKAVPVNVWRYNPSRPQEGWEKVFIVPGGVTPTSGGGIRHFHVCRPAANNSNLWILSSGDVGEHCRLWISQNDGNTWSEIELEGVRKENFPAQYPEPWRFTQFCQLENGELVWGSDDTANGGKSAFYKLNLNENPPVLTFINYLGYESIRNCIAMNDNKDFLLLSESTICHNKVDCHIINACTNQKVSISFPNYSHEKNSFTVSLGSSYFINNTAFIPAFGSILIPSDKRGVFRITVN